MPTDVDAGATAPKRGPIRGPQNFFSGVALIALSVFAVYLVSDLPQGTLRAMGPAMLPRWLAIGVGLCGALLLVLGLVRDGDGLEKWTFRGPVFVALGIIAFGLTIRQFGLVVAGPLSLVIGGFASDETRPRELVIFAIVMTAFCIGLFRYALNQPMPILIVPGTSIHI
jgi:putative tricarboxylic transport membrane protein